MDNVPAARNRHDGSYEMMLSESQERMLAVLKPGREEGRRTEDLQAKWGAGLPPTIGQT